MYYIHTPGLSDTEKLTKEDFDNIYLEGVTKVIFEVNIQVKDILFL